MSYRYLLVLADPETGEVAYRFPMRQTARHLAVSAADTFVRQRESLQHLRLSVVDLYSMPGYDISERS